MPPFLNQGIMTHKIIILPHSFMKQSCFILAFAAMLLSPSIAGAAFTDVISSHDNADAIEYVQSEGVVEGYQDGTYKPERAINRAEFTKIIIGSQYTEAQINSCINQNVPENFSFVFFPDVTKDAWFAKYICIAKDQEIIAGYEDGTFKPEQNISFVEAAKIITKTFKYNGTADAQLWYKEYVDLLATKRAIPVSINRFTKEITRGEMAEIIYRLKKPVRIKSSHTFRSLNGEDSPRPAEGSADNAPQICKNKCGDGVCQEVVCQAEGCPCAETVDSCEEDCK